VRRQVRRLEAALAEAEEGRAADAAAAHRLHEDQRGRLAASGRRLQALVSACQHDLGVGVGEALDCLDVVWVEATSKSGSVSWSG
jgi:hypothetical protein